MNGISAAFFRFAHDFLRIQIAADRVRLVRQVHVQGILIRISEDRDPFDAHLAQRVRNADGDFAAIRDEDFTDHLLSVFSVFSIQGGLWRSRNAFMPACPSMPPLARALASAASSSQVSTVRVATPNPRSF